jgi:hypothetical protein
MSGRGAPAQARDSLRRSGRGGVAEANPAAGARLVQIQNAGRELCEVRNGRGLFERGRAVVSLAARVLIPVISGVIRRLEREGLGKPSGRRRYVPMHWAVDDREEDRERQKE